MTNATLDLKKEMPPISVKAIHSSFLFPDLAVLPLLAEALRADDNWEGELPAQRHRLESIREEPELTSELLLHPVGTLKISQKVVPLNVRIDRIGSQRPSDGWSFRSLIRNRR